MIAHLSRIDDGDLESMFKQMIGEIPLKAAGRLHNNLMRLKRPKVSDEIGQAFGTIIESLLDVGVGVGDIEEVLGDIDADEDMMTIRKTIHRVAPSL